MRVRDNVLSLAKEVPVWASFLAIRRSSRQATPSEKAPLLKLTKKPSLEYWEAIRKGQDFKKSQHAHNGSISMDAPQGMGGAFLSFS
jgi:hypothetical protein